MFDCSGSWQSPPFSHSFATLQEGTHTHRHTPNSTRNNKTTLWASEMHHKLSSQSGPRLQNFMMRTHTLFEQVKTCFSENWSSCWFIQCSLVCVCVCVKCETHLFVVFCVALCVAACSRRRQENGGKTTHAGLTITPLPNTHKRTHCCSCYTQLWMLAMQTNTQASRADTQRWSWAWMTGHEHMR